MFDTIAQLDTSVGWCATVDLSACTSAQPATLAKAPAVTERLADGALSVENAVLLSGVVDRDEFAADAEVLLGIAADSQPKDTRKTLETWLAIVDSDHEGDREAMLRLKQHISLTPNSDGMVDVNGCLVLEDAATVQAALAHIAGAAYADQTCRPQSTRIADALVELCAAYNAGKAKGGRERPRVIAVTPFETIVERAAARGVVLVGDAIDPSTRIRDGTLQPRRPAMLLQPRQLALIAQARPCTHGSAIAYRLIPLNTTATRSSSSIWSRAANKPARPAVPVCDTLIRVVRLARSLACNT